jgi:hypothetical protein
MRAILAAVMLAAACNGGGETPVDGNPGGQVFTLDWGPVTVGPGEEDTRCVTLSLGNDIPLKIHSIHNVLGPASHHFIVYRVTGGTENTTPTHCTPFVDTLDPTKGSPLMITQRSDDTLTLPDGVAYSLAPDQMIRLEMHFINTDPENSVTATASSTLTAMADADFENEADFLFIGNPDIQLQSSPDEQTLGPTWFQLPASLDGTKVFAVTGHEHSLGTGVQVSVSDSEATDGTSVYAPSNFSWSDPETVVHDPPFEIPDGGGFHFSCEWINDTGNYVHFGESATDEMCFFWAYYYPSKGSKVCFHSEIYTQTPYNICCPDDNVNCALLEAYLDQL